MTITKKSRAQIQIKFGVGYETNSNVSSTKYKEYYHDRILITYLVTLFADGILIQLDKETFYSNKIGLCAKSNLNHITYEALL